MHRATLPKTDRHSDRIGFIRPVGAAERKRSRWLNESAVQYVARELVRIGAAPRKSTARCHSAREKTERTGRARVRIQRATERSTRRRVLLGGGRYDLSGASDRSRVPGLRAEGNGAQHHKETGSPVREAEVVSGGGGSDGVA
jgi:hypothetical protein